MKNPTLAGGLAALLFVLHVGPAAAQQAGSTTVAVAASEIREIAYGWSAKKQIIGHTVYNESGDKVGSIADLIVAPDGSISMAIIGAGGFVGLRRHHVAVPVGQLALRNGEFLLPGATKEAIKALPSFDYAD